MTDATQASNGASTASMTTPKATVQGKEADKPNAPKNSPPQDDQAPPASGSGGPTKTPKKRRKVNHGKDRPLCLLDSVMAVLTASVLSSVHILQTFGEPQHFPGLRFLPYRCI
jgi:hypothetical protein